MNINPMQSFTSTLYYSQEKEIQKENKVEEIPVADKKQRDISKEEAAMLLYQYKSTQSMKDQIDTLFDDDTEDSENNEISFEDYRDVRKFVNRSNFLDVYENDKGKKENNSSDFVIYI